jgi:hypothetical protein
MKINLRKIRKILGKIWTAPKRIFETFLHPRSTEMHRHECNTLNFLFDSEKSNKGFSYTIFPVKINVGIFFKLRENRYLIILSIHIQKLEISGCDKMRVQEQDARKFIFELCLPLSLHLALNFKISKIHLKFGSMR